MEETRFRPGDRVWVKDEERPGHVRTPHYIRGKTGQVEAVHGVFRNPELLAYGKNGFPKRPLYLVGFRQSDVWKDRYQGPVNDRIYVDIYEHWLEPASETEQDGTARGSDSRGRGAA